jgi:hypothetical protein
MRIRSAAAALALPLCVAGAVLAQGPQKLADVGVEFSPPAGFKRWTQAQVLSKYPGVRPPRYVFAPDKRGKVSVAVTSAGIPLKDGELGKLRDLLERTYARLPGIKWFAREELTLNGRKWVHLEFQSQAIDTTIRNDTYSTLRKGHFVGVNYNSTTDEHAKAKASLIRSRGTLKVLP